MTERPQNFNVALAILAKATVPDMAKTRLIPALGAQGAADLASKLLARTLIAAKRSDLPVAVFTEPEPTAEQWRVSDELAAFTCYPQAQGDLGARMAAGGERVVVNSEGVGLSGTDCVGWWAGRFDVAGGGLARRDA